MHVLYFLFLFLFFVTWLWLHFFWLFIVQFKSNQTVYNSAGIINCRQAWKSIISSNQRNSDSLQTGLKLVLSHVETRPGSRGRGMGRGKWGGGAERHQGEQHQRHHGHRQLRHEVRWLFQMIWIKWGCFRQSSLDDTIMRRLLQTQRRANYCQFNANYTSS